MVIILIFSSCVTQFTAQKELDCYVPPVILEPEKWEGEPLDTTIENGKLYYYTIDNLKDINTDKSEFDLEFYVNKALLTRSVTTSDQEIIKLFKITNSSFNQRDESDVVNGPNGFPTIYDESIYFSAIPSYLTDAELNYYTEKNPAFVRIPRKKEDGRARIFFASFNKDQISNPEITSLAWNLEIEDFMSHPAISPNGEILFFASNNGDPDNGMDIYYSEIQKGSNLKKAVNINTINSIYEELSPFISQNGKYLYFSANGKITVGGYDIFRSEIDPEFWKNPDPKFIRKPENIGTPINTIHNELFPSSHSNLNDVIYYSSDQPGGLGEYDMWVFHKVQRDTLNLSQAPVKDKDFRVDLDVNLDETIEDFDLPFEPIITKSNSKSFNINGRVVNEDNKPFFNADVTVETLPDGDLIAETKTDKLGEYKVSVDKGKDVKVTADNKSDFFDSFIITKEEQDTIGNYSRDIKLDLTLTLRINFPYNVYDTPYENIIDEKGRETQQKWINEIDNIADNLKTSIEKVNKIILIGHTDPIGSKDYNYNLGLNRVKFVVEQLKKRGIPKELMEYSSDGENTPLPKFINETEENYHRRLRRVSLEKIYKE